MSSTGTSNLAMLFISHVISGMSIRSLYILPLLHDTAKKAAVKNKKNFFITVLKKILCKGNVIKSNRQKKPTKIAVRTADFFPPATRQNVKKIQIYLSFGKAELTNICRPNREEERRCFCLCFPVSEPKQMPL